MTINPYRSPQTDASATKQPRSARRASFAGLVPVWFLTGCLVGYLVIPDFGHPSGQANAGVGGIAALGAFAVYWCCLRPRKQRR